MVSLHPESGWQQGLKGRSAAPERNRMSFLEFLKVILFGLVEGYTEFLPISSTGHLILVENLVHLDQPEEFFSVFKMVIQIGAILAVVLLYWKKLWPFGRGVMKTAKQNDIWHLWGMVIIGCIPAGVLGILLDDFVDAYLSTPVVIGITLVVYGIAFLLMETYFARNHKPVIQTTRDLTWKTALFVGLFQCLSIIPGTSRSGATILGALLLGMSRSAGAEYSFFLGIPVICGSGLIRIVKYFANGYTFTGTQVLILIIGTVVSFITALFVVRVFIDYLKRHDFKLFGWYRIVLGAIVLLYFGFAG